MQAILTTGWEDGLADLTHRLVHELAAGKRVLWLASGGSNLQPGVQIMDNISADLSQNLTVSLADERYGLEGHEDSNWAQLIAAGFKPLQARLLPILKDGLNFEQTIAHYDQLIKQAFDEHDVIIAQLGVGPDGHIAGILPDSPTATEADAYVAGFDSPPLQRMTLTFPGLRRLTAAYVFAFGEPKRAALKTLVSETLPLAEQPAQILKELSEAYLYSDQVGEHV